MQVIDPGNKLVVGGTAMKGQAEESLWQQGQPPNVWIPESTARAEIKADLLKSAHELVSFIRSRCICN